MMFVNFTGESAESLKSKFRKVATSYKGQGLSFLVVDAEGGKGALEDFNGEALEKFIKESSIPVLVTVFDSYPSNRPYVASFFDSSAQSSR
ncbi:hypothetical protein Bca52824_053214 [Brassica carinata]|uniref:Uncharacterized protein n=1 Tax=Brassica carinata TaxID=52824 RepID=A0A8X7RB82_BRACI|nr:hypothetical protein Bca52824_053214 [Brassica carinata]